MYVYMNVDILMRVKLGDNKSNFMSLFIVNWEIFVIVIFSCSFASKAVCETKLSLIKNKYYLCWRLPDLTKLKLHK